MNVLLIVCAFALLLILFIAILVYMMNRRDAAKTEEDVLRLIQNRPDLASMCVLENGTPIIEYEADRPMPLASVCKVIVAIEFSKQAADGRIDPMLQVSVDALDKYYIPGTDGGAQDAWKRSLVQEGDDAPESVTLLEAAKGMIQYSSNANTEYLIALLGTDEINKTLKTLPLRNHDPIYPVSSAFLAPMLLQEREKLSMKEVVRRTKELSREALGSLAHEIHHAMRAENDKRTVRRLSCKSMFHRELQKSVSEKLPRGSARDYAELMGRINRDKAFLSPEALKIMRSLMARETAAESKFVSFGNKGGSTLSILNEALYVKDKNGNAIELALFMLDPVGVEHIWLKHKLDLFLRKLLIDDQFRREVTQCLQPGRS